jgi:hypothetical protein
MSMAFAFLRVLQHFIVAYGWPRRDRQGKVSR